MGYRDDLANRLFRSCPDQLVTVCAYVDPIGRDFAVQLHVQDLLGLLLVFVEERRQFQVDALRVLPYQDGRLGLFAFTRPSAIVQVLKRLVPIGRFLGVDL